MNGVAAYSNGSSLGSGSSNGSASGLEQVVFVTGSSSGNGRGIALAFAAQGAVVICADLGPSHPSGETPTDQLIKSSGGLTMFVKLDVTSDEQWQAAVQETMAAYGRIDILVNNAGILGKQLRLHEMPPKQWDLTLNINLSGVFLGMRHVIPVMLEQAPVRKNIRGKIVNIASNGGSYGVPKSPAYSASKFGVIGLTKQAAVDYSRDGININSVSPGLIATPMSAGFLADDKIATHFSAATPSGRYGVPSEVADAVLFLSGPSSDYCCGTDLVCDGGYLCT